MSIMSPSTSLGTYDFVEGLSQVRLRCGLHGEPVEPSAERHSGMTSICRCEPMGSKLLVDQIASGIQ
jgi:hypothetical protein